MNTNDLSVSEKLMYDFKGKARDTLNMYFPKVLINVIISYATYNSKFNMVKINVDVGTFVNIFHDVIIDITDHSIILYNINTLDIIKEYLYPTETTDCNYYTMIPNDNMLDNYKIHIIFRNETYDKKYIVYFDLKNEKFEVLDLKCQYIEGILFTVSSHLSDYFIFKHKNKMFVFHKKNDIFYKHNYEGIGFGFEKKLEHFLDKKNSFKKKVIHHQNNLYIFISDVPNIIVIIINNDFEIVNSFIIVTKKLLNKHELIIKEKLELGDDELLNHYNDFIIPISENYLHLYLHYKCNNKNIFISFNIKTMEFIDCKFISNSIESVCFMVYSSFRDSYLIKTMDYLCEFNHVIF